VKARDRAIGILLGVLLGIGIVTAFVFLGSEQTIDAPRLEGGGHGGGTNGGGHKPPRHRRHGANQPGHPVTPVATVQVIGGAPPASGPARLDYRLGDRVRLRVDSDATVGLELLGYGIARTVAAGTPAEIDFVASKAGNFPLIVSTSHIAVAQLRVGG
jgi:hypothetical protein